MYHLDKNGLTPIAADLATPRWLAARKSKLELAKIVIMSKNAKPAE